MNKKMENEMEIWENTEAYGSVAVQGPVWIWDRVVAFSCQGFVFGPSVMTILICIVRMGRQGILVDGGGSPPKP